MIIGAGSLASWVLELLVRLPGLSSLVDIVVCDVDEELGMRRVNSVLLGAQLFTDWAYEVMKNALDYDCRELKPEDRELQQKCTAYI